jgi:hypothetical protein
MAATQKLFFIIIQHIIGNIPPHLMQNKAIWNGIPNGFVLILYKYYSGSAAIL